MSAAPEQWRRFPDARIGLFIHWGPYTVYGRGELVLFREHLEQREYAERACRWRPERFEPAAWAAVGTRASTRAANSAPAPPNTPIMSIPSIVSIMSLARFAAQNG